MTLQELFNIVWERAKDKRKAWVNNVDDMSVRCVYRSPEGLCCFIGAAIPPEKYDRRFDYDMPLMSLKEIVSILKLDRVNMRAIEELQRIHDTREVELWEIELRAYALRRNLEIPA
jgi:hypothetical protein